MNNKVKKEKKIKYENNRDKEERKKEIHAIILKLNELKLNNNYEPIQKLYKQFKI